VLEQMSLDAFLAVARLAAWRLDGLGEKFGAERAGEGGVGGRGFSNFGFGDDLGFGALFLPGGTVKGERRVKVRLVWEREGRRGRKETHESGSATTNPPSGVIMIPPAAPSAALASTVLRKDRGIPVVRLNRGRLSNSLSSFVGQFWIQCPEEGKANASVSKRASRPRTGK